MDIAGSWRGAGFIGIHHLVDNEKITATKNIKLIDGLLM